MDENDLITYWERKKRKQYAEGGLSPEEISKIEKLPNWTWKGELWDSASADQKKKELLSYKIGANKPSSKTALYDMLLKYTQEGNTSYDQDFNREIRNKQPQWFIDRAFENKNKIIELSKELKDKPIASKHPLGYCLKNYLNKNGDCYDAEFDTKIHKLAPHWFIDIAKEYKEKLLSMNIGENRPDAKNKLGSALCCYTNKKRKTYDEEFDIGIKNKFPEWFKDSAADNKSILLEMARNNDYKPSPTSKLGRLLYSYCYSKHKSYNEEFYNQLKQLRPDWFINNSTSKLNKEKLLQMAQNNENRPSSHTTKIGKSLQRYTHKTSHCYDEEFYNQINGLRPDWFKYGK